MNAKAIFRQPLAVWVLAFACAVSYMGLGLVDPILPTIARTLNASPGQTELLFTSYLFVTAFVMFFSAWISSRLGVKKTLVGGVAIIVVFALGCALSSSVNEIIGFRAGWGLGNALFVSTALAAIVGSASSGPAAIIFYEAAVGLGFAVGPLVGGLLGEVSWRGPFFGTTALMSLALLAIAVLFRDPVSHAQHRYGPFEAFRAAVHPSMRWLGLGALFYNFAFLMMLVYAPFPVERAAHANGVTFTPIHLGFVFFAWGCALAVSSVFLAPILERFFGTRPLLVGMMILVAMIHMAVAVSAGSLVGTVISVVVSGAILGVVNTLLTTASMGVRELPRPVASSAYSGVRFIGSALAPTLVGPLELVSHTAPLWAAGISALLSAAVLTAAFWRPT
ncbi:MFS transporter [Corynebacterium tapiri]|uniref:MFS transporter n=1 Tax=Corynebacterium tapiri TaxID=1448266 RepID=A0A5C4U5M5_9CORY|nr:MFS transporter [Corynebacterium tapiri]TNL98560.1 MFS transporter [Corynebacterium tapiri]